MIKKLWATKEIYEIVTQAIKNRESSGISRNDTLQMLLDSGDEKLVVVGVSHRLCPTCVTCVSELTKSHLYSSSWDY